MKKAILLMLLFLTVNVQALILNLKNVEIKTFINTVSMATGKNFLIDPRVKGRVNIVSNKDIDDEQLYQIFLTVLKAYGFIVAEGENVSRVLPKNLTKSETAYVSKDATDAIVTKIIRLKDVSAAQIAPIVRPLMSSYGLFSVYAPSNSIVVIDSGANIARLEEVITALDKPIDDDFEFIPIKNSSATQLSSTLKSLFTKQGKKANLSIAVDKHNNQLIIGGSASKRLKVRLLVAKLDQYKSDSGTTAIIYLRYANAKEILPVLQGISQYNTTVKTATKGQKIIKSNIQADESTNSIIITGNNEIKKTIKEVIAKLDVRRAQVLIEAVIAEISTSDAKELGVQWIARGGSGIGLTNLSTSLPTLLQAAVGSDSSQLSGGLVGGLNFATGSYNKSKKTGIGVLINALNSKGNTNILSTPSILTLDNKEAEIVVGQEVPFITNTQLVDGNNPFQNFERKDVGLKLKVKPQINNGSSIKLDIEQEISNVLNSSSAADLITSKRTLKTTVMVEDGKLLVLGGLIDDTWRDSTAKVPVLGSIPGLGSLFTYKTKNKTKSNLMIFIRPTILKDQILSDNISMEKYDFIRAAQLLSNQDSIIKDKNNFLIDIDGLKGKSNKQRQNLLSPNAVAPDEQNIETDFYTDFYTDFDDNDAIYNFGESNRFYNDNVYNTNPKAQESVITQPPSIPVKSVNNPTPDNNSLDARGYKKVKNSPYYIKEQ